ncbi:MAG: hypothetical protein ABIB04_04535 [Patescibacteria group bacterium]
MTDTQAQEAQPKPEMISPIPVSAELSPLDRAIESGDTASVESQVEQLAKDEVSEVKDFSGVAADRDFPQVTEDVQKKAEELEKAILERAGQAQKEIEAVVQESGESPPPVKAEQAVIPEVSEEARLAMLAQAEQPVEPETVSDEAKRQMLAEAEIPEKPAMISEEARQAMISQAEQPAKSEGLETQDREQVSHKLNDAAEAAFAAQDEGQMESAVGDIEKHFHAQIANRQKQLDELYAKPVNKRTEGDQAKIDELEFANAIDRKSLERRQLQLDLIKLKKEKAEVDQEVASIQAELASLQGEEQLENRLAGAQAKQAELSENIQKNETLANELADTILQLTRLMDRAKQAGKGAAEEDEKKKAVGGSVSATPESGIEGYGGGLGGGIEGKEQVKQSSGTGLEDVVGGAFSAVHDPGDFGEKILDKIIAGASSKKAA